MNWRISMIFALVSMTRTSVLLLLTAPGSVLPPVARLAPGLMPVVSMVSITPISLSDLMAPPSLLTSPRGSLPLDQVETVLQSRMLSRVRVIRSRSVKL